MSVKTAAAVLVILGVSGGVSAEAKQGKAGNTPNEVVVCFSSAGYDAPRIEAAELTAVLIFREIEVRIHWLRNAGDCQRAGKEAIIVHMLEKMPDDVSKAALARTELRPNVHIDIYRQKVVDENNDFDSRTLAYVLIHEITHVLEGVSRHSDSGIMKPYWDISDKQRMHSGRMSFAPEDVALIRAGLLRRTGNDQYVR